MRFLLLLALCTFFCGCKSPKTLKTDNRINEQKNIENDLKVSYDSVFYEAFTRAIQTTISERLNLSVKQTIYDTNKPADPETGKPPIKQENDINLTKETDTQTDETADEMKGGSVNSETIDKGKDKTKKEETDKTETTTGLSRWQNFFICFGSLSFLCFVGCLIFKFKK